MNGAHWHLIVNHIPAFCSAFGLLALIWAILRNSSDMRLAAILTFIVGGVFSWIANETGESAAHFFKDSNDFPRELIHTHSSAADYAFALGVATGVAALILFYVAHRKKEFLKIGQWLLLIFALLTTVSMLRTSYLGGLIRHPEMKA